MNKCIEVINLTVRPTREDRPENLLKVSIVHRLGWTDWHSGGWNQAGYYVDVQPIERMEGEKRGITLGRNSIALLERAIMFRWLRLERLAEDALTATPKVYEAIARALSDGGYVLDEQHAEVAKKIAGLAVRA